MCIRDSEDRSNLYRKTKLLEETGNAGGEDGERSSVRFGSVYGDSADNDKGDNAEQRFYDHGAVADHRHIFFVADRLGGSSCLLYTSFCSISSLSPV